MDDQIKLNQLDKNAAQVDGTVTTEAAYPFLNIAALYASDVQRQYKKHRFAIVPEAFSRTLCSAVLSSVSSSKFIIVDNPEAVEITRFYTKNGDDLIVACPQLVQIERGLLEWINRIADDNFAMLDNRSIGISLNVTPPGGGFGTHHDRHEITIVLFLNDADGGELYVYPRFPRLLMRLHLYGIKLLNAVKNPIARIVHILLFRPARVSPRAGTVVALSSTLHRVGPVKPGSVRYSFVIGFDRPGVSFKEGQEYYGYGQEQVILSDVLPPSPGD